MKKITAILLTCLIVLIIGAIGPLITRAEEESYADLFLKNAPVAGDYPSVDISAHNYKPNLDKWAVVPKFDIGSGYDLFLTNKNDNMSISASEPVVIEEEPIVLDVVLTHPSDGNGGLYQQEAAYSIDVSGSFVEKKLIKEGYHDTAIITGIDYPSGNFHWGNFCFGAVAERLGSKGTAEQDIVHENCLFLLDSIEKNCTLEEAKKCRNIREFIDKAAVLNNYINYINLDRNLMKMGTVTSDDIMASDPTNLNDLYSRDYPLDTFKDADSFIEKSVKGNMAAGYTVEYIKKTAYLLKISKQSPHLNKAIDYIHSNYCNCEFREDTYVESDDSVIIKFKEESVNPHPYKDYTLNRIKEDLSAADIFDTSDEYSLYFEDIEEPAYSIYYPFTYKQFIDAWAAEMDSDCRHWDSFIENWGSTSYYTPGNATVSVEGDVPDKYEYSINGPGTYTITATGKNVFQGTCSKTITVIAKDNNKDWEPFDLFTDVKRATTNTTSYNSIFWATSNGIVKGYSDGTFRPEYVCTREQFSIMLWRFVGQPDANAGAVNRFTDAGDFSDGAKKAVAWAVEQGIVAGFNDGSFKPKDDITRAQVAVMLWRYAGKPDVNGSSKFSDIGSFSSGVQNAIIWLEGNKIASGYKDGTFQPNGGCQRQHMAIFLYRYSNNIK